MRLLVLLLLLPSLAAADEALADLVERVAPSVVNLNLVGERQASAWDVWFGGPRRWESLGSGFVVDAERGWIVTNEHVVRGAATIRVQAHDGRVGEATVVGADEAIDLALLRVDGLELPAVELGRSDGLRVGQDVFAVGNPYGHGHSVTRGILSARARSLGRGAFDLFLQTDAAINPGNSGGPLFDAAGRVVGVNTAVDGRGEGIGFAMPVELLLGAMPYLQAGRPVPAGWPGLLLVEREDGALEVSRVYEDGPAAEAGVRPGDVVRAIGGRPTAGRAGWAEALGVAFPGQTRALTLERGAKRVQAELALIDRDAWAEAKAGPAVAVDAFYVTVRPVPPDIAAELGVDGGLLVVSARGGAFFEPGDVLLSINGQDLVIPEDLEFQAGQSLRRRGLQAVIVRGGARLQFARRW
jgi:serine protease Do